jgi:hypothetical protein
MDLTEDCDTSPYELFILFMKFELSYYHQYHIIVMMVDSFILSCQMVGFLSPFLAKSSFSKYPHIPRAPSKLSRAESLKFTAYIRYMKKLTMNSFFPPRRRPGEDIFLVAVLKPRWIQHAVNRRVVRNAAQRTVLKGPTVEEWGGGQDRLEMWPK